MITEDQRKAALEDMRVLDAFTEDHLHENLGALTDVASWFWDHKETIRALLTAPEPSVGGFVWPVEDVNRCLDWFDKTASEYSGFAASSAKVQPAALRRILNEAMSARPAPDSVTDYVLTSDRHDYRWSVGKFSPEARMQEAIKYLTENSDRGSLVDQHIETLIKAAIAPKPCEKLEWQPIETVPKGENVLFSVNGGDLGYKDGSVWTVIGVCAKRYTIPAHDDCYEPEKYPSLFECHEESGEWFAVEGFYTATYENQYGDEIYNAIKPTHWMALPVMKSEHRAGVK